MRLSSGPIVLAVALTGNPDPRIQIRSGPLRLTMTEREAVALATEIIDTVAELRAGAARHNGPQTAHMGAQ
jgi:hypothetical protein